MTLIDSHSHLNSCKNIPEIIEKCSDVKIVSYGTSIEPNRENLKLKEIIESFSSLTDTTSGNAESFLPKSGRVQEKKP